MNNRALKIIVLIAGLNVALALVVWSVTGGVSSLKASAGQTNPPAVVRHLAELFANAGLRSVITLDYTPLNTMIKQSARWPDIVYVSVEDSQGKILAHTDPSRPGQTWSDRAAAESRAKAKVPYEDIVVAMADPTGGDTRGKTIVGRVRVGYVVERSMMAEPRRARFPLWAALLLAAVAGIPAGAIIARLIPKAPEAPPSEKRPTPPPSNGDDVNWRLDELRAESGRLKNEVAERGRELARIKVDRDKALAEAGTLRNALAASTAEKDKLARESTNKQGAMKGAEELTKRSKANTAELSRLAADYAEAQAEANRLRTQFADRASELAQLRSEFAKRGHELESRETMIQELRAELERARSTVSTGSSEAEAEASRLRTHLSERASELAQLRGEVASRGYELLTRDAALAELRSELERARTAAPSADTISHLVDSEVTQRHGRAVTNIAQVFRSALTSVLGFSKLLLRGTDGRLNESQATDVQNIQRAGNHMLSFVNVLSDMARADMGALPRNAETFDVGALIREVAGDPVLASSATLKFEGSPEGLMVEADRGQVAQIVRTLIQQGVALPGQGEVVLAGRVSGDAVVLDVAHPGRSLEEDTEAATLFDPFPSDASSADAETVVGRLHLAFARSLASLNGGVLTVDSRLETGVVFTLTLAVVGPSSGKASAETGKNQEAAR